MKGKIYTRGLAFAGVNLLLILVIVASGFLAVPEKKSSLIIAVYDQQAAVNHLVHLQRITFSDGVPAAPENLMDVVTQKSDDKLPRIRFDLGSNQVYRNRWIITAYGNVIDLQQKKILVDAHDQFVRASGDSIVFYTNDIFRGKFYSVLDLKNGIYAQVKSLTFHALPGKDVQADCTLKNFKIYYYPTSSDKVELVRDAGFGEDVSLIPEGKSRCPIYWIDNDNFIYPNYSLEHDFVSIVKVSVSEKSQEKIGDIDQLPENHELSRFYRNAEGEIIYLCARGHFKIDVSKKKVSELLFLSAGNGFSIAVAETDKKGRAIRNGEQLIGTYFCDPELACSTSGYLAFPYEIVLGDEHYLQGVAVYSNATQKWKTIGDSDLSAVIGWTTD